MSEFSGVGNKGEKPKVPKEKSNPPSDIKPNKPPAPKKKHEPMHIRRKNK